MDQSLKRELKSIIEDNNNVLMLKTKELISNNNKILEESIIKKCKELITENNRLIDEAIIKNNNVLEDSIINKVKLIIEDNNRIILKYIQVEYSNNVKEFITGSIETNNKIIGELIHREISTNESNINSRLQSVLGQYQYLQVMDLVSRVRSMNVIQPTNNLYLLPSFKNPISYPQHITDYVVISQSNEINYFFRSQPPVMGTFPSELMVDANQISEVRLAYFAIFYGTTFSIENNDTIQVKRSKFIHFLRTSVPFNNNQE